MFQGKMKAVTFSYDDGVTQDLRLIEMLNRYGMKGTFNLNSGNFGGRYSGMIGNTLVYRDKVFDHDVKKIYEGHEVASHTVNHPDLTKCDEEKIIYQVEEDRRRLSELVGYDIVGFAYPCGYIDDRVVDILKEKTGIRYARKVEVTRKFDPPSDLFRLECSTRDYGDKFLSLAEEFVALKPDKPQIFSVWGHAYEFDCDRRWYLFEEFCKIISGHDDIFYGTNAEVFLADEK